jgi:hypothetical protein
VHRFWTLTMHITFAMEGHRNSVCFQKMFKDVSKHTDGKLLMACTGLQLSSIKKLIFFRALFFLSVFRPPEQTSRIFVHHSIFLPLLEVERSWMLDNLICWLQQDKETWSAFLSDSEEAKKMRAFIQFKKNSFLQKTVLPPFPPDNIYHTVNTSYNLHSSTFVPSTARCSLCKGFTTARFIRGVSTWRLWFNSTAVSAGFLVQ